MGLPSRLSDMSIEDADATLRKVADTCLIMPGCARQLSRDEIYELLHDVA